jgi:predicted amidohydrolase
VGVTICEDIWNDEDLWPERRYRTDPVRELAKKGIDLLINLSASPWHIGKEKVRYRLLAEVAKREKIPVVQVNQVGEMMSWFLMVKAWRWVGEVNFWAWERPSRRR